MIVGSTMKEEISNKIEKKKRKKWRTDNSVLENEINLNKVWRF